MTDKELDDLFQKTLSGHQRPVPPDMWQRVNPQNDKRRRVAFLWWSGLGMAALFMLTGSGIWLYHVSSGNTYLPVVKQTGTQQKKSSSKQIATLPAQPAATTGKSPRLKPADNISSAQTKQQAKGISGKQAIDFYRNQTGIRRKQNNASKRQHSLPGQANNMAANTQNNTQPGNHINSENNDSRTHEKKEVIIASSNDVTASSNPPDRSAQKPDSSAITTADNSARQQAKAAAVKVKKMHGEKASSFELMVAGYGNDRNVYDVSRLNAVRLFAFGPISQKEKVLMQSFSINARIDKPVTKHLSLKTGLQYLQTRQRLSYGYETVNQSVSVNAVSNDTTLTARLQSSQSVVKGTYNSLNVPVLVSYHTNGTKVSFSATAGVMVNVLSWYGGEVADESTQQVVTAKSTFRKHVAPSLYAGITAAKQIGGFRLFAGPHMQYTVSSLTKSPASFRQKITGYGFGIGIRKTIGK